MTVEQRTKSLVMPRGRVDVVIDTDARNEVDDQFAISYLLRSGEKLNTVALYAAPFSFPGVCGTAEGMESSYVEILKLLELAGESGRPAYRGSDRYLPSATEPVISDAATDLVRRARKYSPENPLYVIAIGALTNIASALMLDEAVRENTVIVWLGGHGRDLGWTDEFNMRQDLHAARIVMECGVPFVQIPCEGVANAFSISEPELREYLVGKNPLADYLAGNVLEAQKSSNRLWSRVLWDVCAVGWLLGGDDTFMISRIRPTFIPTDDCKYVPSDTGLEQGYVCWINRETLMTDLIHKLTR